MGNIHYTFLVFLNIIKSECLPKYNSVEYSFDIVLSTHIKFSNTQAIDVSNELRSMRFNANNILKNHKSTKKYILNTKAWPILKLLYTVYGINSYVPELNMSIKCNLRVLLGNFIDNCFF